MPLYMVFVDDGGALLISIIGSLLLLGSAAAAGPARAGAPAGGIAVCCWTFSSIFVLPEARAAFWTFSCFISTCRAAHARCGAAHEATAQWCTARGMRRGAVTPRVWRSAPDHAEQVGRIEAAALVRVERIKLREEGFDVVPLEDLELGEHAHDEFELVEAVVVLVERADELGVELALQQPRLGQLDLTLGVQHLGGVEERGEARDGEEHVH